MSYGRYLRELLAPLRLYDLEAPFNGGRARWRRRRAGGWSGSSPCWPGGR